MPRPARIQTAGIYHVSAHGNAGDRIVLDDADREGFLQIVARAVRRHSLLVHAYCLLDDRYELLLETSLANLSVAMREMNGLHAQRFNQRHGRLGHLFGDRYASRAVDPGLDVVLTCTSIVLAPVRAGDCGHPGLWRWSSYAATANDESVPPFLTTSTVLDGFAPEPARARAAFRAFVARECRAEAVRKHLAPDPWSVSALGARAR